jgi:hypothetical protein
MKEVRKMNQTFWQRRWQLIVALTFLLGVPLLTATLAMLTHQS